MKIHEKIRKSANLFSYILIIQKEKMVQVKQQSKVKNEYERKAAMKPSKNIIPLKNYILIIKHKKYYNWGVWGGEEETIFLQLAR